MLTAINRNHNRKQTHHVGTLPAPSKGLNTRDDISGLAPDEAWLLDNVVVEERGIRTRQGHESFATGLGASCDTLMVYSAPDGTQAMFAATPTDIYDVSTTGAVGAAVQTSLTNGTWDWVNFTTTGGSFLVACNGADDVRNWDGTTWTTPSITGMTSNTAVAVNVHMQRIWFTQINSLDAWYLGTGAISGAATKLPLGQVFKRGGYLMAMGSWSRDGADGVDDLAVFITSEGEVAVYTGTDPASSTTWSLVGVTQFPEPIGRRCFRQVGADLGIVTRRGVVSLAAGLGLAHSNIAKATITDKIRGSIIDASADTMATWGWQILEDSAEGLLVVNAVINNGVEYNQFIMNTSSRAWSRWTGLNGKSWAYYDNKLYFGTPGGTVYKVTGDDDLTEAVDAVIGQGFYNFGTDRTKAVRRVRPHMLGPPGYKPRLVIRTDYNTAPVTETASTYSSDGPEWDVAAWDVSTWGSDNSVVQYWQAAIGQGFVLAPVVLLSTLQRITYHGCKVAFEVGDNL